MMQKKVDSAVAAVHNLGVTTPEDREPVLDVSRVEFYVHSCITFALLKF